MQMSQQQTETKKMQKNIRDIKRLEVEILFLF